MPQHLKILGIEKWAGGIIYCLRPREYSVSFGLCISGVMWVHWCSLWTFLPILAFFSDLSSLLIPSICASLLKASRTTMFDKIPRSTTLRCITFNLVAPSFRYINGHCFGCKKVFWSTEVNITSSIDFLKLPMQRVRTRVGFFWQEMVVECYFLLPFWSDFLDLNGLPQPIYIEGSRNPLWIINLCKLYLDLVNEYFNCMTLLSTRAPFHLEWFRFDHA